MRNSPNRISDCTRALPFADYYGRHTAAVTDGSRQAGRNPFSARCVERRGSHDFQGATKMRGTVTGAALVIAAVIATTGSPTQASGASGAVYTATNSASGNAVLVFDRTADGGLTYVNAFATGGHGSGSGLGNQGGLALTADGKFVLVVNAGSNELSVLQTTGSG